MNDIDIERLIQKAKSINDLHASHERLTYVGQYPDGAAKINCSCGVDMRVEADAPKEEPKVAKDGNRRVFVKDGE